MREIGTLVWVVLVIVGVIGSMISSVRRQAQAPQRVVPPRPGPLPGPPRGEARVPLQRTVVPPPQSAPRPPVPAEAQPHGLLVPERPRARPRFFAERRDLVRGIIAAEVLGKPRALNDEQFPR